MEEIVNITVIEETEIINIEVSEVAAPGASYDDTAILNELANKVDNNDSRLSDPRTPLAHTHAQSEITNLETDLSNKVNTNKKYITDLETIYNYKDRVIADGGTFESAAFDKPLFSDTIGKKAYMLPSGYKAGKLYGILGNDFTVSRNSTKTRLAPNGYLETLAVNVPSIEGKQLVVEDQRTNLILRSEEFENSSWVKNRMTVSANQITAPNGLLAADKLIQQFGQTLFSGITQNVTVSSGLFYTQSIFAKKGEKSIITCSERITSMTGIAHTYFDLNNGVVAEKARLHFAKIDNYGNGWYKCSIGYFSLNSSSPLVAFYQVDTDDNTTVIDSGGLFVFGAQLELGSKASSYIPTTSTTVTRLSDTITVPVPSGTTQIKENVNGVVNTITTIPSTYTVPNGKIDKIEML